MHELGCPKKMDDWEKKQAMYDLDYARGEKDYLDGVQFHPDEAPGWKDAWGDAREAGKPFWAGKQLFTFQNPPTKQ
jgi:hypothetical protein